MTRRRRVYHAAANLPLLIDADEFVTANLSLSNAGKEFVAPNSCLSVRGKAAGCQGGVSVSYLTVMPEKA